MRALLDIPQDRPFLAYTRKWGWIVVKPALDEHALKVGWVAFTRPNGNGVYHRDILAVADLPPAPDAAL